MFWLLLHSCSNNGIGCTHCCATVTLVLQVACLLGKMPVECSLLTVESEFIKKTAFEEAVWQLYWGMYSSLCEILCVGCHLSYVVCCSESEFITSALEYKIVSSLQHLFYVSIRIYSVCVNHRVHIPPHSGCTKCSHCGVEPRV
jgi:hypothetical protein